MSQVFIEPATAEHLPAIRDLAAIIWHAHYPGIISVEQIDYMLARMYSLETLRDEMRSRLVRFDRLLLEGKMIGFASYGSTAEPAAWKLHKLYLLPDHHGRGFGSELLRHCEDEARTHGAQRMQLNVNKRNTRAIAAYTRNGYSIVDSVCLDIGNGFVMDDFLMARKLA